MDDANGSAKQADSEVRAEKEILQTIFDHIPLMIRLSGADGRVKLVNRAWEQTVGWTLEELQHDGVDVFAQCYPDPEERARVLAFIGGATGEWADFTTRVRNGRVMDTSFANVRLSDGRVIGFGLDVTERKRAEDRFRLVLDTIPALVSSTLPDGSVASVNQRWLEYRGLAPGEGLGWSWEADLHPDDLPRVLAEWRAALARGEPVEMESRVRRADGEYRWFLHRCVPLRDDLGDIVKWYTVSTDIEDRKRAEDELRQSESQLAEAQRLAHIGSWHWDLRSDIHVWSDELYRIVGLQPGRSTPTYAALLETVHRDDRVMVDDAFTSALRAGKRLDVYYRVAIPGGGERIMHSRGNVVSNEHGVPIRMFGTTQDVTDRTRAEQERESLFQAVRRGSERLQTLSNQLLSAQEAERRAIARELHDDIGQVLTAVSANLQAVRISSDPVTLAERLNDSIDLVDEALRQVRDLALELRPSLLDDFGLVTALGWFLDRQGQRSRFTAAFVAEPADMRLPPNLETTVFRIVQIAVTNVARHSQATLVTVELRQDGRELELVIRDNGVGFDVSATLERASHGATLGLLSMHERARLANGVLAIESGAGKGTEIRARFQVEQPVQPETPPNGSTR